MKRMVPKVLLIIAALGVGEVSAQSILKDIWVGVESSSPKEFTKVGGNVYFAADNGSTGIELWKTDGTEGGTVLVKDINVSGNSDPSWMAGAGALVFFRANDGVNGDEVWVSDGTAAGTRLTMDSRTASPSATSRRRSITEAIRSPTS